MNTTISPQIRILAVVGLLAAVGLGASLLVFGHGSSKTAPQAATTHAKPASSTPTTPHAHSTPRTHPTPTKTAQAAKHATKTHVAPRSPAKKAKPAGFRGNRVYATLPQPLQWALAHHKVVVVSLYNPSSEVDAISVAEAHAGAIDAGAGFLLVSVLDNKVAGILTALLPGGGLLPDPGVLVYRAPGDIAIRIDGFADRASVAQAATNVISGQTGPAVSAAAPATTGTP
jgi:hypothetical protein